MRSSTILILHKHNRSGFPAQVLHELKLVIGLGGVPDSSPTTKSGMEFFNDNGVDPLKPSLFELLAQEQLRDLLQPALKYVLTVLCQFLYDFA